MSDYTNGDTTHYKKYICLVCGWVYDEQCGAPEEGIAAGTLWVDIPDDWVCPDCGASKDDFEMVELKDSE